MSLIYLFTKIGRRTNHNDKSRTKNNNIVKDTVYHLFYITISMIMSLPD